MVQVGFDFLTGLVDDIPVKEDQQLKRIWMRTGRYRLGCRNLVDARRTTELQTVTIPLGRDTYSCR